MRWIFDINNPIMRYVIKIFDCMCLSVLWLGLMAATAMATGYVVYNKKNLI